jgi:hypothetical protein
MWFVRVFTTRNHTCGSDVHNPVFVNRQPLRCRLTSHSPFDRLMHGGFLLHQVQHLRACSHRALNGWKPFQPEPQLSLKAEFIVLDAARIRRVTYSIKNTQLTSCTRLRHSIITEAIEPPSVWGSSLAKRNKALNRTSSTPYRHTRFGQVWYWIGRPQTMNIQYKNIP